MNSFLNRPKESPNGHSGKAQDVHEKRKFPRFAVAKKIVCFRYGREMTMRTVNISLGGLKLAANFDLGVGESMDLAILTNGTRIPCKGRILAIEDFRNKVHARLRFAHTSDMDFWKLSDYLDTLSLREGKLFQKWVIGGLFVLLAYIAYLIIWSYFLR
ncbi:MAG: PilZ domain-containing protein [Thermodesulfobacteriota bacterium]